MAKRAPSWAAVSPYKYLPQKQLSVRRRQRHDLRHQLAAFEMAFQRHSQLGVIAVVQRQRLAPAQQRTVAVNGALPRRQNDQPPPMGLVCGQVCPAPELVKCVGLGLLGVLRVAGQNGPADDRTRTAAAVLPQAVCSNSRSCHSGTPPPVHAKIIPTKIGSGCFH